MKIICYGDSNTWGYDPRGPFAERYPTIWPELLAQKFDCVVVNQGENGREVTKRSASFPDDAGFLIVMLGTNDLLQSRTPESVCVSMERFLLSTLIDPQRILLIAPPYMQIGEWVSDHTLIDQSRCLAKCYQSLAQRLDIHFVNAGEWNIPLAFDGVHFTQEGHSIFAEKLADHFNTMRNLHLF